jgi:hypothetical protein
VGVNTFCATSTTGSSTSCTQLSGLVADEGVEVFSAISPGCGAGGVMSFTRGGACATAAVAARSNVQRPAGPRCS